MRGILLICLRRLGRDLKLADGSNEDKVATGMPRSVMTIRSLPAARLTQRPVSRWSSRMLIFFMCTLCYKAVCSFKLAARVRSYESLCALSVLAVNSGSFFHGDKIFSVSPWLCGQVRVALVCIRP